MLQLEWKLLDAVVSESSNDTVPLSRRVQRTKNICHGACPVQTYTTGKQKQCRLGWLTRHLPGTIFLPDIVLLLLCHHCIFHSINTTVFFQIFEAFIAADKWIPFCFSSLEHKHSIFVNRFTVPTQKFAWTLWSRIPNFSLELKIFSLHNRKWSVSHTQNNLHSLWTTQITREACLLALKLVFEKLLPLRWSSGYSAFYMSICFWTSLIKLNHSEKQYCHN